MVPTANTGPTRNAHGGIRRIVAVSSAKGGVGKSTLTVNLAVALAAMGRKVGILDADILGPSVPGMLGIASSEAPRPGPSGKVAPAEAHGIKTVSMAMFSGDDQPMMLRGPMVGKYLNLFLAGTDWGELDLLLLDMPPGTGDIQLNIAQAFPLAGAIIVTTPQAVSTRIARRGARMFETLQTPILGVVENMRTFTCPDCGSTHDVFGHGGGERLADELGVPFLTALPLDPAVIEGGDRGVPVLSNGSASGTSNAYRQLAEAIEAGLDAADSALPPFRWRWDGNEGAPEWRPGAVDAHGAQLVPVGLRQADPRTLAVLWQDGAEQRIPVRKLRLSCGCALCRDEMTGRPLLDPASVPDEVAPVEIRSIGRYAIGLDWTDGHTSGIHPFAAIRALGDDAGDVTCPADASTAPAKPSAALMPRDRDAVIAAIEELLDGSFNATLARHGGSARLVDYRDGVLSVELRGRCQGCAASQATLKRGLAAQLRGRVPEVREIVDATNHETGSDPYFRRD